MNKNEFISGSIKTSMIESGSFRRKNEEISIIVSICYFALQ